MIERSGIASRKGLYIGLAAACVFLIFAAFNGIRYIPPAGAPFADTVNQDQLMDTVLKTGQLKSEEVLYGRLLSDYVRKETPRYTGEEIEERSAPFLQMSQDAHVSEIDGVTSAMTEGENGWLEWEVDIPETALYQIQVQYQMLPGGRMGAERSLLIDGKRPFAEAARFLFPRMWQDNANVRLDDQGNEIRPEPIELREWREMTLQHPEGFYKRPFLFLLEQGKHTIRLTDIREPMAVSRISLTKPVEPRAYTEVESEYVRLGFANATAEMLTFQSEHPKEKSELSLWAEWTDDPRAEPKAVENIRYNAFGGERWKRGGQSAAWEIEVPEDGLYTLGFRYTTMVLNSASRRDILIDGRVPFAEMEEYAFPFVRGWHTEPLQDGAGKPFHFYLTKGKHTITLVSKVGPLRSPAVRTDEMASELNLIARQVIQITASSKDAEGKVTSDRNQDWNLERNIPDLSERLQRIRSALAGIEDEILAANGGARPSYLSTYASMAHLLDGMIRDTEKIPYRLNELGNLTGELNRAAIAMQEQPLMLDYLAVGAADAQFPQSTSSYLDLLVASGQRFWSSFSSNTSQVGKVYSEGNLQEKPVLNIWVARGREWAALTKNLIDEDFTPKTGIEVNVNTVPGDSEHLLLLAYTAGEAPDIAFGVSSQTPVDFAARNALLDLSSFADTKAVTDQFVAESLIPYRYAGGLWALPETQDFQMLFYRTDMFDSFGWKTPDTWEDVYQMLPLLQEQGLEFYYPSGVGGFAPFLFQRGGDFYASDQTRSKLDSPEAFTAFKEWTALSTNYKLPLKADFFQRFRLGEMPVGVGNYEFYVRLKTSAPELNGSWAMIPLPGMRSSDGEVDRSIGGAGQTAVILKTTKHPDAAWALLKWWLSEETQTRYGLEVEGLLGAGSRWNTANVRALQRMPWTKPEIEAILEQWSWFKEQPVVMGGYYTSRHLQNAWNKVVLNGDNPRTALEDAIKEIDKEILRKREEFNIKPTDTSSGGVEEGGGDS
ncbi:extracellular solute-binding protein [Paenibacillus eucommiae]|uniref:ABC-type glycerol-3-phosphate transport system substrate-binding protein n=1 Tax=Paenibacillus eucommiae TaxID=1355755 RepID=A0ABS4IXC5_9BACL|nr:extracellular solute-binding protein [Paenibacillus eucommiae]MBP1991750.1 ABC-type glycerol-3-phosphate transport system substrate-binding protein [Paenibacillus eucommiae]